MIKITIEVDPNLLEKVLSISVSENVTVDAIFRMCARHVLDVPSPEKIFFDDFIKSKLVKK